jgi:hypothetical protein
MKPETIKYHKKVDQIKPLLERAGFDELNYLWYSDGLYSGNWKDMSVAHDVPEHEPSFMIWQFGFRAKNKKYPRVHLEAIIPVFEDYFVFELRYYPEIKLHNRRGLLGPSMLVTIGDILEQDLTKLTKYIKLMTKNE